MSNRVINILVPIISIIIGLIAGAVVMFISGYDPIKGYSALWNGIFGDMWTIGNSIRTITPYILAGLLSVQVYSTLGLKGNY